MRLTTIILALTIPLLILLAAVNGALLYLQSRTEMARGLDDRALAAAITGAEFLSSVDDPDALVGDHRRRAALASAARHVAGLDGYSLVTPAGTVIDLIPAARPFTPVTGTGSGTPFTGATAAPLVRDADGRRHVVAHAPLAGGGFVAARIDAEPMFARLDRLLRWIVAGVAVAALVGLAAGWYVARRIRRELAASRRIIAALDAGRPAPDVGALTITEAADLAAALRLLDANRHAALAALDRRLAEEDRGRTDAAALATWRGEAFAPLDRTAAGAHVAARLCGDAAPGAFFALGEGAGQAVLVVGQCGGDTPLDALAHAVAARDFLTRNLPDLGVEEALALARDGFGAAALRHVAWSEAAPPATPRLLAVADAATFAAAETYGRADADAPAGDLLDRIAILLRPDGVIAVAGPA